MPTVFITGANRGLGLEFVSQYAQNGWHVLAACRSPQSADALQALAATYNSIELIELDVTDEAAIQNVAEHLNGRAIDHLLLNAGVLGEHCATLGEMTQKQWLEVLNVNTVAPALLIQALRNNVIASQEKTIIGISTRVASLADNSSGNMYSYRASKTALNQVLVSAAQNLREHQVKTLAIHPGWVQTDMGGENATFTAEESVRGIIKVASELTLEQSGQFRVFDGAVIPW
ncbi:SDR family oxidoreductase [Vibrio sp. SM6]|uniref:SDR family oxidoreductase n=1 Tax=Vibrio agarilyticus TaxID=2726741 RepID=A0A7X8TS38_9VIBR|nr:SDR family oxidoreductase [Vibrio agarilyticus]NLS13791.1 SDR family oxidoreductase [Vibrio agarilyticus]